MFQRTLPTFAIVSIVICASAYTALAANPDQVIVYRIREDPKVANSAVVFEVSLELTRMDQDGNAIGWQINLARFAERVAGGSNIEWTQEKPLGSSLWWVEHAVPSDPQLEEFDGVPLLQGTAASVDPQNQALDYDLEGTPYTSSLLLYSGRVTALTYTFTKAGQAAPEKEGDDEPVEIDGEGDPD